MLKHILNINGGTHMLTNNSTYIHLLNELPNT